MSSISLQTVSGCRPPVVIIAYDPITGTWSERRVDYFALTLPKLEEICYIFLEDGQWFKGQDDPQRRDDRRNILSSFQVPDFVTNHLCTDLNGFFGCQSTLKLEQPSNQEILDALVTWFRILTKKVHRDGEPLSPDKKDYQWYEMGFFTRWNGRFASRVMCIDTPLDIPEKLLAILRSRTPIEFRDPLGMLRPLLDCIMETCDDHTWRVSKQVRQVEKQRLLKPDFERLQNLARHSCHLVEVQHVAIETIQQLVNQQEKVFNFKLAEELPTGYKCQAAEYLAFQSQLMKSLNRRAQANSIRLQGEISLEYNMLANADSQIVKSITLLTMIFLPGTFLSAMFSTPFFKVEEERQLSDKFWIYWAFTLPLTLLVLIGWWVWIGGSTQTIKARWLGSRMRAKNAHA